MVYIKLYISDLLLARIASGDDISFDLTERLELTEAKPKKLTQRGATSELEEFAALLTPVTQKLQRDWLKSYDLACLKSELSKAQTWLDHTSPKQKPKNVAMFLSKWLNRSARKVAVAEEIGLVFK